MAEGPSPEVVEFRRSLRGAPYAPLRASEAVPLDHPLDGDPEYCCADGGHNFHFRPGAPRVPGHLISCCCKSLTTVIEDDPPSLPALPPR